MHKCALLLLVVWTAVSTGQILPRVKSGDCPPPFTSSICNESCRGDVDCPGQYKCCITSCNGFICVMPVTKTKPKEKRGSCPMKPMGPWVCSNTCRFDSDCRGSTKCCRGRCPHSMICQKPAL